MLADRRGHNLPRGIKRSVGHVASVALRNDFGSWLSLTAGSTTMPVIAQERLARNARRVRKLENAVYNDDRALLASGGTPWCSCAGRLMSVRSGRSHVVQTPHARGSLAPDVQVPAKQHALHTRALCC